MTKPILCIAAALLVAAPASGYPLDGFPWTGIKRLEAYRLAAQGSRRPSFLTEGEMLPGKAIQLNLVDHAGFQLPAEDSDLSARIRSMLGADAGGYGIALLDYSDPSAPRYAGVNASRPQNPGSVGKILVALGWFQALADQYPDVADRQRLLKESTVTADAFIRKDAERAERLPGEIAS